MKKIIEQKNKRLSDSYQRYTLEQKESIVHKNGDNLNANDLSILFNGSLPVGTYDEIICYLPNMMQYLTRCYWESVLSDDEEYEEIFKRFLMWTVFFHNELSMDGKWDRLNQFLSDLFSFATSRFELCNGVPAGRNHIGYFFLYFGNKSFMQIDDPLGTSKGFPFGVTDKYMEQRFKSLSDYVDHAWLILLVNGCRSFSAFYGVDNIKDSSFLEKMRTDIAWRSTAVLSIIAETERHPELLSFWSACLDDGMFF